MRITRIRPEPREIEARDIPSNSNASAQTLSEAEAARYLGMSPAWLKKSRTRRFVNTYDAPPFVRNGRRRIVYRRIDLDDWQRRHVQHAGPESAATNPTN